MVARNSSSRWRERTSPLTSSDTWKTATFILEEAVVVYVMGFGSYDESEQETGGDDEVDTEDIEMSEEMKRAREEEGGDVVNTDKDTDEMMKHL